MFTRFEFLRLRLHPSTSIDAIRLVSQIPITMHHTCFIPAAILAVSVTVSNTSAQAQSRLLGIPFGEKLVLAQCPANTEKANTPCWIDRPVFYKQTGSKSGYVYLPNPKERPEWAAHVMFRISVDKDARVQELKVNTLNSQDRIQIAESISKRFGKPFEDELRRSDISWASWRSTEGHVEMRCKDECWIDFRTPAAQATREAEMAERAKVNAARPTAP